MNILRLFNKTRMPHYRSAYLSIVKNLKRQAQSSGDKFSIDDAMRTAVGGSFYTVGGIERELLLQEGLEQDHYLIDVGCGSGRLAYSLKEHFKGRYLGLDVVPDLVKYAEKITAGSGYHFALAEGLSLSLPDEVADFICFFSVFTHLRHEESYVYLRDALRVLRPGGKIVFSFLDFTEEGHWPVFESNINSIGEDYPLNQFISKDMISIWLMKLGLNLIKLKGSSEPFINIKNQFLGDEQKLIAGKVAFGQSVCVAQKSSP